MKHKWLIFTSTSILLLLMNIDMTAVNLALAQIARDLKLHMVNVQWIISAYLLGGAAFVMFGGILGDNYGHKRIFLLGAAIFTIASLGVGLAINEWQIIMFRLAQGLGAALAWPLAIVIVRDTFADKEALAMGLIVAVMGASMSVGPPLGGVILHYLGWRWIFFINLPLGAIAMLLGILYLKNIKPDNPQKLHIPSSSLLIISLLLIIYALNEMQTLGISSPIIIAGLIVGFGSLALFVYLQKIIDTPLIDLSIFKNYALSSCFAVRFLWQVIWIGLFLALSLMLQNIFGFSALKTSFFFLVSTTIFAIISPFGGTLCEHYKTRTLIITSFSFYILCFLGFATISMKTPDWQLLLYFSLYGIGSGIGFPSLLHTSMELSPPSKRGMVSGTVYAMLFAGGSIGATVAGSIIAYFAPQFLQNKLQQSGVHLTHSVEQMLSVASTGVRNLSKFTFDTHSDYASILKSLAAQSFLQAFMVLMCLYIIISLLTSGIAWMIKDAKQ